MLVTMAHFPLRDRFGEEKAFEMIKNAGFDGVDYSFNGFQGEGIGLDNHLENARETKRLLVKYGLVAHQAHAPFVFRYGDEMSVENKDFHDIVKCFEYASIIGCKVVIVHSLKMPDMSEFFDYNYTYYKTLEPYAKKYGVKIAVENLRNSRFHTPEELDDFVKRLDSDTFTICVDVGHCAITGCAPEKYIAGMEKGTIECVHLHDTDCVIDCHWTPYQGNHNWSEILSALKENEYSGDMNLEVIHTFDNIPDELLPDAVNYVAKVGRYMIEEYEK